MLLTYVLGVYAIGCTGLLVIEKLSERKRRLAEKRKGEFNRYYLAEVKLMEIAKWIESQKANRDLGATLEDETNFMIWWIQNHAEKVRMAWKRSKCKSCVRGCYYNLKEKCNEYVEG